MTVQEKREQNASKRSQRTIARIDKEILNLRIARDKVEFESPEFRILDNVICYLIDAQSDLEIVVSRISNNQKGMSYG